MKYIIMGKNTRRPVNSMLSRLICPILIICLGLHQNTVVFYMKYL